MFFLVEYDPWRNFPLSFFILPLEKQKKTNMNRKDNLFFHILPLLVYPPEGEWVAIFSFF